MLASYVNKLPATKSSRHNRVIFARSVTSPVPSGVLTIVTDRGETEYALVETWTDWVGRAFALVKIDTGDEVEEYNTFVGKDEMRCTCKGWERTGGCKHVAAVAQLLRDGEL